MLLLIMMTMILVINTTGLLDAGNYDKLFYKLFLILNDPINGYYYPILPQMRAKVYTY